MGFVRRQNDQINQREANSIGIQLRSTSKRDFRTALVLIQVELEQAFKKADSLSRVDF